MARTPKHINSYLYKKKSAQSADPISFMFLSFIRAGMQAHTGLAAVQFTVTVIIVLSVIPASLINSARYSYVPSPRFAMSVTAC